MIDDISKWMEFHKARNSTSRIYDSDIAEEVYGIAVEFLPYAKEFLKRLEERND